MGLETQSLHRLGKEGCHLPVAVDHENVLGLGSLKALDPCHQVIPVGMGGQALEVDDLGVDGDLLAEELHLIGALQQGTAQRALTLEAHEHDGGLTAPQVVLQVVADAARVAHTGGRDDHLGGGVHVQSLGLLAGLRHPQIGEVEHMGAVLHQLQSVLVQIAVEVAHEDGSGLLGQRRVDIHREIGVGLHQPRVLDLTDEVQQLLSAAHGKGGNHHVAAPADGLVNDGGQFVGIAPDLGVVAVAVGRLHHHIVRTLHGAGIPDDGLLDVAQVAGEHQLAGLTALGGGQGDDGAAQQVAGIGKFRRHALAQVDLLSVLAGGHKLTDPGSVLNGIERLHLGGAGTLRLAVLPLSVGFLNVGGVCQHDVQQVGRQPGGDDAALEPLLDEHGHAAGVVDMGVGDQHAVDGIGSKGELRIVDLVPSLLQTAVDQDVLAVDLQTVTTAGHALIGAEKAEFHRESLLISIIYRFLTTSFHLDSIIPNQKVQSAF